jgi:hypothetical protein
MGFLDHSTNNIIVDAVLTDTGRKTLAKNDGSFVISKFAFGDDEVDYSMIKKFGVTVGKEKITKNTPVFEAQTNGDLALKYRLLSVSTPDLVVLPLLSFTLGSLGASFTRGNSSTTTQDCICQQTIAAGLTTIATDLVDSSFIVQYDNRFLSCTRSTAGGDSTKSVANNIATKTVAASSQADTCNGGKVSLRISVASFSDDYYNTYATSTTSNAIKTQITITGRSSGASVVQEFTIIKS